MEAAGKGVSGSGTKLRSQGHESSKRKSYARTSKGASGVGKRQKREALGVDAVSNQLAKAGNQPRHSS
jgi:hypothetical protein